MEALTVLSLFDGMSCGRIALERAGIPVKKYYVISHILKSISVCEVAEAAL